MKKTKPTSLPVSNEIYLIANKKQSELIQKTGIYIQLKDIANLALEHTIDLIDIEEDKDGNWSLNLYQIEPKLHKEIMYKIKKEEIIIELLI